MRLTWIAMIISGMLFLNAAQAARIKDIASIQGVRSNQLVGYGLVVGLDGTGDKSSAFTEQSFRSMLAEFGIQLPLGKSIDIKNVAAVALSSDLPPFAKHGQKIDVTVSSIGSAKSLRGGTLLMSPLRAADGKVYAIAQGHLVVSGLGAEGADGSKITVNITSVGRIPNGATVERVVPSPFNKGRHITFNLHNPDFTTSRRIAEAINHTLGSPVAKPIDAASIIVIAPKSRQDRVNYLAMLENIDVIPDESGAKIVVNSRTGTIVIGQHVQIQPAAISHGSLTVTISENAVVSQPNVLSTGTTTVTPSSSLEIKRDNQRMFVMEGYATLKDLVNAVNAVGAAPGDLMAILEALKEVNALQADLVVI